jgi:hypothetical protein
VAWGVSENAVPRETEISPRLEPLDVTDEERWAAVVPVLPVYPQPDPIGAFHEALVGDRCMLLRIPRQAGRSVLNSRPIPK